MSQSYTVLRYHLIFGTKNHAPFITPDIRFRLYDMIGGILRREAGALLMAGGTADHVHLLALFHPQRFVFERMCKIKSLSSKWIHETVPEKGEFAWQVGDSAFSVSQSASERIERYIESQPEHHRRVSYRDELIGYLERHGVAFDPKYLG